MSDDEEFMNEYFVVLLVKLQRYNSSDDEHVEKLFVNASSGEEAAKKAIITFYRKGYDCWLQDIRRL
ncbi:MAG: hypothetical protein J6P28_03715 [Treponema sp.]|nr:hypothetical protein [Treponema sp.]